MRPFFTCLLLLLSFPQVIYAEVVYESSAEFQSGLNFSSLQRGSEVILSGSHRTITQLDLLVSRQSRPGTGDFVLRFYANDGDRERPGTLLWESDLFDDVALAGDREFLEFAIPNVVVPDRFTWTAQVSDSKGEQTVAIGFVTVTETQVGSFEGSWFGSDPPITRTSSRFGARLHAVPEPASMAILLAGAPILLRRRKA